MADELTPDALLAQVPRLRRYARALTGSREAADDLTQDTLERAWNKRRLWRARPGVGDGGLRAWLFAVMHNVFINNIKRLRPTEPLESQSETFFADGAAGTSAETAVVIGDIEAALRRLPGEQRAVVLLVGLEQLSYEEAAQALEVPIGTVMSRLSRGRERLRELLEGRPVSGTSLRRVK